MDINRNLFLLITFGMMNFSLVYGQQLEYKKDSLLIRTVRIDGNIRTKTDVIKMEIPISENHKVAVDKLEILKSEIKQNLIKTSLFNFVETSINGVNDSIIDINIHLQERWYLIPRIKIKTEEENINAWAEKHDFGHVSTSFSVTDENFRGRREHLSLSGSLGFNKTIGLKYLNPAISKSHKFGTGFEILYTQNKEIVYGLFDYKPNYFYRSDSPVMRTFQASIYGYYRPTIYIDELFSVRYFNIHYSDTLKWINRYYFPENSKEMIQVSSKLKFDFRDNKAYPLSGSYFDLIAEYQHSIFASQTQADAASVVLNCRGYKKIGTRSFIAIGGSFASMFSNKLYYYNGLHIGQSGLELRSFEQLQIPVKSLIIGRPTYKYQIINVAKQEIKCIHNPKFALIHYALYATIFADGAYANYYTSANYEQYRHLANHWLSSAGIGLDLNTYYDIVLRAEYSYNFAFDKKYFFIHFKTAI